MTKCSNNSNFDQVRALVNNIIYLVVILFFGFLLLGIYFNQDFIQRNYGHLTRTKVKVSEQNTLITDTSDLWQAQDIELVKDTILKAKLLYGLELVVHTAKYLGPKGSVMQSSNGLNCQNCHLDAGTKPWGNNYGSVFSLYPKFRPRSGSIENIYKRINDCFERSLNGMPLDIHSEEMQAMKAYIEYIGANITMGSVAKGSGLKDLQYLDRQADVVRGKQGYIEKCALCHQANGEGVLDSNGIEYIYPPLWGKNSYNDGAGLYRVSNFAKYIKYNMPQGVTFENSQLDDDEAWDIAAFVNSQSRPKFDLSKDWPDISKKPIDHPFGPFIDTFTENQHKYGPWQEILATRKSKN